MPPPFTSPSRRRKRPRSPPPETLSPAARDWAALPADILFVVFLALGPRGILMSGADRVCTSWRRIAVGEPSLWRRIDMTMLPLSSRRWRAMLHAAMERSAGQCEAFEGGYDCDDASLRLLADRAPSLKSLRLFDLEIDVHGAIWRNLPLLEHLEVSFAHPNQSSFEELFQAVCKACPCLMKLSLVFPNSSSGSRWSFYHYRDDDIMCPIPVMHELRSLQLLCNDLTQYKLRVIIDKCLVLESLHISGRWNVGKLNVRYARLKILHSEPPDFKYSLRRYGTQMMNSISS